MFLVRVGVNFSVEKFVVIYRIIMITVRVNAS